MHAQCVCVCVAQGQITKSYFLAYPTWYLATASVMLTQGNSLIVWREKATTGATMIISGILEHLRGEADQFLVEVHIIWKIYRLDCEPFSFELKKIILRNGSQPGCQNLFYFFWFVFWMFYLFRPQNVMKLWWNSLRRENHTWLLWLL